MFSVGVNAWLDTVRILTMGSVIFLALTLVSVGLSLGQRLGVGCQLSAKLQDYCGKGAGKCHVEPLQSLYCSSNGNSRGKARAISHRDAIHISPFAYFFQSFEDFTTVCIIGHYPIDQKMSWKADLRMLAVPQTERRHICINPDDFAVFME